MSLLQNWRWSSWRQSTAINQVLAWLRLLTNRLLQDHFHVLQLWFLSQDSVSQSTTSNYSSSTPRAICQHLHHAFKTPSSVQMRYSGFTWKLLLLIAVSRLLLMLIFFELLVPSTSSLTEVANYLCVSWSAPRDLFMYRWRIHGLSLVESYLNCSKHFLVIMTFLSVILWTTNYILVVHTLTMCHQTIFTINLAFHRDCTWHTSILCHRLC